MQKVPRRRGGRLSVLARHDNRTALKNCTVLQEDLEFADAAVGVAEPARVRDELNVRRSYRQATNLRTRMNNIE